MKSVFSRLSVSVAIAAAALLSVQLGASAQEAPNYNYIGIGGGDNGFVVNSKLSLHDNISIRPEVATDFDFDDGDDVNYTLPITYDFNSVDGQGRLFPFLGAGIDGQIGDNSDIELAVTGGADYRISEDFLVNGSVVWSPFADGDDDFGFVAGIGYSF